jgi:hypothetical protein
MLKCNFDEVYHEVQPLIMSLFTYKSEHLTPSFNGPRFHLHFLCIDRLRFHLHLLL